MKQRLIHPHYGHLREYLETRQGEGGAWVSWAGYLLLSSSLFGFELSPQVRVYLSPRRVQEDWPAHVRHAGLQRLQEGSGSAKAVMLSTEGERLYSLEAPWNDSSTRCSSSALWRRWSYPVVPNLLMLDQTVHRRHHQIHQGRGLRLLDPKQRRSTRANNGSQ